MKKRNKQIILFDIDYTLIDTSKLRELIEQENCRLLRLRKDDYRNLARNYSSTLKSSIEFSPRNFLDFLEKELDRRLPIKQLLNNYFEKASFFRKSLYPEVLGVLKRLAKNNRLGIFSEGVEEFQRVKLRLSGIIKFIEPKVIFIYPDKSGKAKEVFKKIGSFWLVDNDPKHLVPYLKVRGILPILVKRSPFHFGELSSAAPELKTIRSLEEIEELIKKKEIEISPIDFEGR